MKIQLGYCTNVHAGADFRQMKDNLVKHACAVRDNFAPGESMGLGLWFSARSAKQLLDSGRLPQFREWLEQERFVPFTLNGFPYGDFHQAVVKHQVYHPIWGSEERTRYTRDLITVLDGLLPAGMVGSISTLPIAWGQRSNTEDVFLGAARELIGLADELRELEDRTGRRIVLCLEPEPGCLLSTSENVVDFFERYIVDRDGECRARRRYLQVCHDTCHASVMFEDPVQVVKAYRAAGIGIGKVQVSSAIRVRFAELSVGQRDEALGQLHEFAESRYLHQTSRRTGDLFELVEDLPILLDRVSADGLSGEEWRVHFHVPLSLAEFGWLKTTRDDTRQCLEFLRHEGQIFHFEAETYAWNVLPDELRPANLADGIAQELHWTRSVLGSGKLE